MAVREINQYKTIDNSKVPLALVKRQKWVTHARQLTMIVSMFVHRTWSN